jgi:hypothetical protein
LRWSSVNCTNIILLTSGRIKERKACHTLAYVLRAKRASDGRNLLSLSDGVYEDKRVLRQRLHVAHKRIGNPPVIRVSV